MKLFARLSATFITRAIILSCLLLVYAGATAQISPPGYEREMKMREAEKQMSMLDRDTITVTDTVVVFDPTTYEESVMVVNTKYSLRDYCKNVLGIPDPDILLDRKPHTIVDPKNYGDMIIRLNEGGKIDTIQN